MTFLMILTVWSVYGYCVRKCTGEQSTTDNNNSENGLSLKTAISRRISPPRIYNGNGIYLITCCE